MTVTLKTLLEEQHRGEQAYAPVPGTLYEISEDGTRVRLLPPTMGRIEAVNRAAEENNAFIDRHQAAHDGQDPPGEAVYEGLQKVVTCIASLETGQWPPYESAYANVMRRIKMDFTRASSLILPPATPLSSQQSRILADVAARLVGQANGLPEQT